MNKCFSRFGYILICLVVFSRCTTEDCVTIYDEGLRLVFADTANKTEVPLEVTFDSIFALGAEFPYAIDSTSSSWFLPLNPFKDSTYFVFIDSATMPATVDTLGVRYTTNERLIGIECGTEIFFTDLEAFYYTKNAIDSARVADSTVFLESSVNVYLYRLQ